VLHFKFYFIDTVGILQCVKIVLSCNYIFRFCRSLCLSAFRCCT